MNRKIKTVMEGGYQSAEFQKFCHMLGYKIELSPTRDKHAHGVAERSIENIVTKANTAMASFDHSFDDVLKTEDAFNAFEYYEPLGPGTPIEFVTHPCPPTFCLDAVFYTCHNGFGCKRKIGTSPYFYINQRHIHLEYLHSIWTPVYLQSQLMRESRES